MECVQMGTVRRASSPYGMHTAVPVTRKGKGADALLQDSALQLGLLVRVRQRRPIPEVTCYAQ